ncbi:MAG: ATP-binding protein, partial [Cyanobacteriota bacterium]|nr:ATP-binding protein [Cyanobacteriota bacterium]
QESSRIKSEFLAIMSHELRTPLNAIMGFSQMLQLQHYGSLTPRQADMVDRIFNNSQSLLEMLNEVLDFSKIEAGGVQLQPESFDANALVRLAVEELRSLAQRKNLTLDVRCSLSHSQIFNDRNGVHRILVNLLSNAIKFTETGTVTVEVEEIGSDAIAIAVKDTGIGISQEDIGTIFDAFRQVDQTLTRQYAGTGLGLAITQSLIEMMQGRIAVESEVGKGTAFRVELPRRVEM